MRERMFLMAYRRELAQRIVFPSPTNWLVLPPGYEGSRQVALKVLNGHLEKAHDYIDPPAVNPKLAQAVTAEDAIGDLPPIYARQQLASGDLRRGARRFDQAVLYDRRRKMSPYAQSMRAWPGFEASDALKGFGRAPRHGPRAAGGSPAAWATLPRRRPLPKPATPRPG
jgi:DNA (cytosine-5)-methyltransferase 1